MNDYITAIVAWFKAQKITSHVVAGLFTTIAVAYGQTTKFMIL